MAGELSIMEHRRVRNSRSGSVLVFVLMLGCFLSVIAGLFMKAACETLKYRQQMNLPVEARIEAYSFLDVGLAFLDRCTKDAKVPQIAGSGINPASSIGINNSESEKLIFDYNILGKNPSDDLISDYISRCIGNALGGNNIPPQHRVQQVSVPENELKGYAKIGTNQNEICLKHNGFQIEYTFEDLSGKIPLCKNFYNSAIAKKPQFFSTVFGSSVNNNLNNFFNNTSTPREAFSTEEEVYRMTQISRSDFGKYCTIDPCAVDLAMKNSGNSKKNPFKLNLLSANRDILSALGMSTSVASSSMRNFFDSQIPFNGLVGFCSTCVSCFSLKVRVSKGSSAFTLICYCTCNEPSNFMENGDKVPSRFAHLTIKRILEI